MARTLILLRHGRSEWNEKNLFTGWYDADLIEKGEKEAARAGDALRDADLLPDVVHTSVQTRAIRTANLALDACGRSWIPVRRSWRLNERHYGELTGKDKKQTLDQYGADQFYEWRRSYDVPPPPIAADNPYNPNGDVRYSSLDPADIPLTECLADVVARMMPYWHADIAADLAAYPTVLVAAHGNSLRALVMHLDQVSRDDIAELNLPTGVPLVYELNADNLPTEQKPTLARALGDPDEIAAAAAAVASQGGGPT